MALWHASFPEKELQSLISDQWKEMGWQGKDPTTDFRYSVEYFAFHFSSFQIFGFYVMSSHRTHMWHVMIGAAVSYHWKICCILQRTFRYTHSLHTLFPTAVSAYACV